MQRIRDRWRRDGWLLTALGATVVLCLLLGTVSSDAGLSQEERRISQVLSAMEGAGAVEVALYYEEEGAVPSGAVVVAQGAEDIAVRLRLTRAVCTLLGIEPGRVEVFKREGGM